MHSIKEGFGSSKFIFIFSSLENPIISEWINNFKIESLDKQSVSMLLMNIIFLLSGHIL